MKGFDFELDIAAFGQYVLKAEGLREELERQARTIQRRCGDGYIASSTIGRKRALAMVRADDIEAIIDNSENNTLLKAIR